MTQPLARPDSPAASGSVPESTAAWRASTRDILEGSEGLVFPPLRPVFAVRQNRGHPTARSSAPTAGGSPDGRTWPHRRSHKPRRSGTDGCPRRRAAVRGRLRRGRPAASRRWRLGGRLPPSTLNHRLRGRPDAVGDNGENRDLQQKAHAAFCGARASGQARYISRHEWKGQPAARPVRRRRRHQRGGNRVRRGGTRAQGRPLRNERFRQRTPRRGDQADPRRPALPRILRVPAGARGAEGARGAAGQGAAHHPAAALRDAARAASAAGAG